VNGRGERGSVTIVAAGLMVVALVLAMGAADLARVLTADARAQRVRARQAFLGVRIWCAFGGFRWWVSGSPGHVASGRHQLDAFSEVANAGLDDCLHRAAGRIGYS
jgi:hypothetical protein